MTKLVWDPTQAPPFHVGLDKAVLYLRKSVSRVWNGLSKIVEKSEGSDSNVLYFDGVKVVQQRTSEVFSGSIEAYTYPPELDNEDIFDLSYRVTLDSGYEIHILYNVQFDTSEDHSTINQNADPSLFTFDVYSIPIQFNSYRASSHFIINSNYADPDAVLTVEDALYGTDTVDPDLPTIEELLNIFDLYSVFVITDNGDGTWTATGPDSWFETVDSETTIITTPSVDFISEDEYNIHSW